ncbi:MAG: TolC family protein [Deltaproteobacteria bacterium]|nr:TolC family protein [Deltaproteobacteria bacterium]
MVSGFTKKIITLRDNRKLTTPLLILFFSLTIITGNVRAESVILSLSEAFFKALKANRTIVYYDIDKNNAEMELEYQKGIFIPQFDLTGTWNRYSWESDNVNSYSVIETPKMVASIQKMNSFGGVTSLNFSTQEDKTVYSIPGLQDDEYRSSIFLKYEQPLLKGRGKTVTNYEINKSSLSLEFAKQRYEDNKNAVLFNVFKDYFSLLLTIEELRIKKEIRENTQSIFDVVKEKVEMRKLPVTDLNKMQTVLFIRDKEILDIENTMQQKRNQLMLSIFNDVEQDKGKDYILTTSIDEVIKSFKQPDLSEIMSKAESLDLDIIGYKNDLERYNLELTKAQDDLKPELLGSVEMGADGYDSDKWLRSARDISPQNYRIIFGGSLTFPITNTRALSRVKIADNKIRQVELQRTNRLQEVRNAIYELFDDLETFKSKVELAEEISSISKQNLEYEIERLVGEKTTVLNTLDYQTSMITAELDMIATKLDYIILIGVCHFYQREMEKIAIPQ